MWRYNIYVVFKFTWRTLNDWTSASLREERGTGSVNLSSINQNNKSWPRFFKCFLWMPCKSPNYSHLSQASGTMAPLSGYVVKLKGMGREGDEKEEGRKYIILPAVTTEGIVCRAISWEMGYNKTNIYFNF